MKIPIRSVLLLLLAAAVIPLFVNLGAASIWDANEAYYVETPREMIERGDFINPSFNYEPRFNKPVLSYWVVAGLYKVLGVSVGVQRLAIAIAAAIMVIAAFFIARAASTHPLAPVLAALGLAAGPRFFMFSRRILVDMALTAMMTLTLLFFVLAERYPERRRLFLSLMYVSAGLGVLTKGPIAIAIPLMVFVTYLAVYRELPRLRAMMLPAGALIVLAVVAPWYVLLYLQHGWTYITSFFIDENFGRYTETVGLQARGPFFYVPVLFSDSLPWSLCLPAVVMTWWRERRPRIHTLLLLWIAITVFFFSLSQTKQDLYIFSIVVPVAALGGDWIGRRVIDGPQVLQWTLIVIGIIVALLGGSVFVFFGGGSVYQIGGAWLAGAIAIAGGVTTSLAALRHPRAAVVTTLAMLIAFNWVLAVRALPGFERYKPVVPLSREIAMRAGPGDVITHFDIALPSMVFYLQRHIDVLIDPRALQDQLRGPKTVYAVLAADRYARMKDTFGIPTCMVAHAPTSDIRLRSVLGREPPPEILVVTNRCS